MKPDLNPLGIPRECGRGGVLLHFGFRGSVYKMGCLAIEDMVWYSCYGKSAEKDEPRYGGVVWEASSEHPKLSADEYADCYGGSENTWRAVFAVSCKTSYESFCET